MVPKKYGLFLVIIHSTLANNNSFTTIFAVVIVTSTTGSVATNVGGSVAGNVGGTAVGPSSFEHDSGSVKVEPLESCTLVDTAGSFSP